MTKEPVGIKDRITLLGFNHKDILERADRLYDAITNLRYEGKAAFGKNMTEAGKVLEYFNEELVSHMKLEDTIFVYIETHIPKLESVIRILQAEHKELKVNLEVLGFLFRELSEEKNETRRTQTVEKLKDKGTYFVYLLRNHIQAEEESIYRTIDQELHADEKKEPQRRIDQFEQSKS